MCRLSEGSTVQRSCSPTAIPNPNPSVGLHDFWTIEPLNYQAVTLGNETTFKKLYFYRLCIVLDHSDSQQVSTYLAILATAHVTGNSEMINAK